MVYDINLLPKAKKNEGGHYGFIMLLIGMFCVLAMVIFFFLFPMRSRIELSKQIADYNKQKELYIDIEVEYVIVAEQLQQLQIMSTDIAALKEGKIAVSEVLEGLGSAMPVDVTLSTITAENGLLKLTGTSESYKDISRFIVNLRKVDKVENVTFTSALRQENTDELASSVAYDFTVYIQYEAMVITEMLEQEALGEQGGE